MQKFTSKLIVFAAAHAYLIADILPHWVPDNVSALFTQLFILKEIFVNNNVNFLIAEYTWFPKNQIIWILYSHFWDKFKQPLMSWLKNVDNLSDIICIKVSSYPVTRPVWYESIASLKLINIIFRHLVDSETIWRIGMQATFRITGSYCSADLWVFSLLRSSQCQHHLILFFEQVTEVNFRARC